jgi:hypothetical protein
VPATPPAGWTLREPVGVGYPEGRVDVQLEWVHPDQPAIYLSAFQPEDGSPIQHLIGPQRYEEIEIDGQPAGLVVGGWDSDTQEWAHPDVKTIF